MTDKIHFEFFWTDQPVPRLKNDFLILANTVFGAYVTEGLYRTKFTDNIYGPSLVTVAYVDGVAAGTDVMWRNDLGPLKAYQTVDTCVLKQFRGKGLFRKLTCFEMEQLGNDVPVYGFPNENSYPGYIKMGWHVEHLYKSFCLTIKNAVLEDGYAAWWLKAQNGISCIRKRDGYYLVRKNTRKPVATLLGRVSETTARLFPETVGPCLLKAIEAKSSIYNMNFSIPLVCNRPGMKIPYWKIDAI